MKIQEIRKMTAKEISALVAEKQAEIHKMQTQVVSGQLKKTHMFSILRRDIARMMMVLKEQKKHA